MSHEAVFPTASERLRQRLVARPHVATWGLERLLRQCSFRTQSRSGPGGQHRNRTASGVFVSFDPLDVLAEATEARQQAQNRAIAITRLRYHLAIAVRSPSIFDESDTECASDEESEIRRRYVGGDLRLNDQNVDKPAVLALLLNDLHAAGGQPSLVGPVWRASTSRIMACVRSYSPAMQCVNQIRAHHGRRALA